MLYEAMPQLNTSKNDNLQNSLNNTISSKNLSSKSESQTSQKPHSKFKPTTEYSKSEIIEKINKIFLNKAQFSSIENDYFISPQTIQSILSKSKIISKGIITKPEVDLIMRETTKKKNLNLLDFINFITKLCHKIYKEEFEENPKETLNYFLSAFFNNYEETLNEDSSKNYIENSTSNSCTVKSIEMIITSSVSSQIVKILNSLLYTFKSLYETYFIAEMNPKENIGKLQQQSIKDAIRFCRDFEIVPYLINESNFVTYFNFIIKYMSDSPNALNELVNLKEDDSNNKNTNKSSSKNNKDNEMGQYYKLSMFILSFYHFALIVYYKQVQLNFEKNKENDIDILLFFLERLDNSRGLQIFLNKRARANDSGKITLIPSNQILAKVRSEIEEEKKQEQKHQQKGHPHQHQQHQKGKEKIYKCPNPNAKANTNKNHSIKDKNFLKEPSSKTKYNLGSIMSLNVDIVKIVEDNLAGLSEVYLKYSRLTDKTTFNRMALSSYIKFLKHANIVIAIPDELKKQYQNLGKEIMKKTFNVSMIKKFNVNAKGSYSHNIPTLTDEEKDYLNKISYLVNCRKCSKEEKISEGDASVIFYSLTGYKNQEKENSVKASYFDPINSIRNKQNVPTKMDFYIFLKSFELLCIKLYPNEELNDAFLKFFNNKIKPILPNEYLINSEEIQDAIERINNKKIKEFLIKFSPVIQPHYSLYCDPNGNMRFCHYLQFYKEYDLFPDLVNLIKLKNIFFTLTDSNNKENKKDYINFPLFLESLAITAMFFNYKDMITDMDRMLYLAERLNQCKRGNMISNTNKSLLNPNVSLSKFFEEMQKEYPASSIKKIKLRPLQNREEEKERLYEMERDNEKEKKNFNFDDIYPDSEENEENEQEQEQENDENDENEENGENEENEFFE